MTNLAQEKKKKKKKKKPSLSDRKVKKSVSHAKRIPIVAIILVHKIKIIDKMTVYGNGDTDLVSKNFTVNCSNHLHVNVDCFPRSFLNIEREA